MIHQLPETFTAQRPLKSPLSECSPKPGASTSATLEDGCGSMPETQDRHVALLTSNASRINGIPVGSAARSLSLEEEPF
jgi:hypothetical protein